MFPLFPRTREGRLILALVVALFALAASVRHGFELQGVIDAKPTVQDRIITKTVQGPTRTEIRTIIRPGGERIEEKIVYVESKTTEREKEHSEAPAAVRLKTRYVGLGINPQDYARPIVRAGLTVWGTYDLGGTFDTRRMIPGVEASWRF